MGRLASSRLISSSYRDQLRVLHRSRTWGDGGHKFAAYIYALATDLDAHEVLDYGCGRGTLKAALPGLTVHEFDPGIPGKDQQPAPADIVVCSDVLEHVERGCLDAVLGHLWALSRLACFAVISTRPAHTKLPDGRNAHLIVAGVKWWLAFLETRDWSVELIDRSDDQMIVVLRK